MISFYKTRLWLRKILSDVLIVIAGAALYGASFNIFLLPHELILGGFTGIGTLLNVSFDIPAGTAVFILNLPFMIVNIKYYGFSFLLKTLIGITAVSLAMDLFSLLPVIVSLSAIFSITPIAAILGGILTGIGCGLLFRRGYTTGGTDLVAWLLHVFFPRISIGRLIFICDCSVILISAFVLKSISGIVNSLIASGVFSATVDVILKKRT